MIHDDISTQPLLLSFLTASGFPVPPPMQTSYVVHAPFSNQKTRPGTSLLEINRSGFLPLLQVQKHLQDQEQGLLPDSGASVQAGPPVQAEHRVGAEPHVLQNILLKQNLLV